MQVLLDRLRPNFPDHIQESVSIVLGEIIDNEHKKILKTQGSSPPASPSQEENSTNSSLLDLIENDKTVKFLFDQLTVSPTSSSPFVS